MDGKYEFVSPEWDSISDSAKDLVSFATKSLNPQCYMCMYKNMHSPSQALCLHNYMHVHVGQNEFLAY